MKLSKAIFYFYILQSIDVCANDIHYIPPYAQMDISYDNFGSSNTGKNETTASLTLGSIFGSEEIQVETIITSKESNSTYYFASFSQSITDLWKFSINSLHNDYEYPYQVNNIIQLNGNNETLEIGTSYLVMQKHDLQALLIGSWNITKQNQALSGIYYRDTHLRFLELGTEIQYIDAINGYNNINVYFYKGFNVNGASQLKFNKNIDLDFKSINLYWARNDAIKDSNFELDTQIYAQISKNHMPLSQMFTVGGAYTGRGFQYSEIYGDSGISLNLELHHHNYAIYNSYNIDLDTYIFYDYGQTHYNNDSASINTQSLSSIGAGLSTFIGDNFMLMLYCAKPMHRTSLSGYSPDMSLKKYFELNYKLKF